jgi:alkylhydroperoxidase/carboxymuconolactone decarboxylase family protein YurZ
VRCDDCIGFHVKAAFERGASEQEVTEALGMAIYMGAGPSVMYASHALEAFNQFAKEACGAAIMRLGDGANTRSPAVRP